MRLSIDGGGGIGMLVVLSKLLILVLNDVVSFEFLKIV